MRLTCFASEVDAHPDIEWVDIVDDYVIVKHEPSKLATKIKFEGIGQCNWAELFLIISGQRELHNLKHLSRVVGYFSRVENWNKSKQGELEDRHKGDYVVKEQESAE